jgi:hypothetical protein
VPETSNNKHDIFLLFFFFSGLFYFSFFSNFVGIKIKKNKGGGEVIRIIFERKSDG